ncbi:MAG: efflux RND transporter periplasmic adaptor subunit [Cyanobacterium sp. T60_A2020_053]|nr:efflux RND transporter periplasmic adaptor subunit [Cyanobacterium sp. T60_A2020_053]
MSELQNQVEEVTSPDDTSEDQETKNVKKTNWLGISSGILLIGGVFAGGWYWYNQANQPQEVMAQMPPTGVELMAVGSETIEISSEVLANFSASQTVALRPEIDGRITDIFVREGDTVSVGQELFALDSETLQAELRQAEAGLTSALATLAELEAGSRDEDIAVAHAALQEAEIRLNNAREGASPEEIAQAQAQVEQAQADANLATERVKRNTVLVQEGAISQDRFDALKTEAESTRAQVEQAQRRLSQLKQGRQSNLGELQAQVEQAQQNLNRVEAGARSETIDQARANVSEAEANVARLQSELDKAVVRAPIDGIVGDIPVKIGEYVQNGDNLTNLTQNDLLELNLSVPVSSAPQLRLGLPVEILDQEGNPLSEGEISFISPNVSADSQLILAKANFPNGEGFLNRQFISARIIWSETTGVTVPTTAISRIGGQNFVFVAQPAEEGEGLIALQKQVELGTIQGNTYEVISGLEVGDEVVTAGILKIRDGSPIQPL